MPSSPTPFADNWAYLKTELNWLERLLMLAIARQRQDTKEIDRVAQTAADRATSHWWKGIISTGRPPGYDDCRGPLSNRGKGVPGGSGPGQASLTKQVGYQKQLEARIRASQAAGIVLGLPTVCDRFELTLIEKNLILFALAPEVNRRYGRLYRYLQPDHDNTLTGLPSIDLVLRLLCRNDVEWRRARAQLTDPDRLVWQQLIQPALASSLTLLDTPLRLPSLLLNYLLAEQPQPQTLDCWPSHSKISLIEPYRVQRCGPEQGWDRLILPTTQRDRMQLLCHQVWESWHRLDPFPIPPTPGKLLLLTGPSGTGKTAIAHAIAHDLTQSLVVIDLAQMPITNQVEFLQSDRLLAEPVVLIEAAHHWCGRDSAIDSSLIMQGLQQRLTNAGITILTSEHNQSIRPRWRQRCDLELNLTIPDKRARQQLWQATIPPEVTVARTVSWSTLAAQFALTGGEIQQIVQTAIAQMTLKNSPRLTLTHLKTALTHHGHT